MIRERIGRWGLEPRLEIGNARSEARWLRYWNGWREDIHQMGPDPEERCLWLWLQGHTQAEVVKEENHCEPQRVKRGRVNQYGTREGDGD